MTESTNPEGFVKVLQLAQQLKVLQVGQITVAVDGTKVLANASQHSAVSYERAGPLIQQLELEVRQLLVKAEPAEPNISFGSRPWSPSLGSSRVCWGFGDSCCEGSKRCRWNGHW